MYVPKSPDGVNENKSAEALRIEAVRLCVYGPIIYYAMALIKGTALSSHMCSKSTSLGVNEDQKILLDADLMSLAAPYEVFVRSQKNIILENKGSPSSKDDLEACSTFLQKFTKESLGRKIYRTKDARAMWEDIAQGNISKFKEERE